MRGSGTEQTQKRVVDDWRSSHHSRSSSGVHQSPPIAGPMVGDIISESTQPDNNSTSEHSIYDREREHCYQNVQKDETGRLLNRDTTVFGAAVLDGDTDRSLRPSDISPSHMPMFGDCRITYAGAENDSSKLTVGGIQRTSRSVDNISNQESLAVHSQLNSNSVFHTNIADQLPYHTGRSTFYKRVDPDEGE